MSNNSTKRIELANSRGFALVDGDDYERVSYLKWRLHPRGYAQAGMGYGRKGTKTLLMHRLILNAGAGHANEIDHINGNKLDNRRENLRVCKPGQNKANMPPKSDNKSGFKGVSWSKNAKKWAAFVKWRGHSRYLGYFDNPVDAARAYDDAALEQWGEFAKLNFHRAGQQDAT